MTSTTPRARPDVQRRTYSVQEAAASLGLSRRSIYTLIDRGELEACKVLDRRLILAESLDALVERARAA